MIKAVLHIDHEGNCDSDKGLALAFVYIEQLRQADPQAAIVVVATATGVEEYRANSDNRYRGFYPWREAGVVFVACEHSFRSSHTKLLDGVQFVPFGLAYVIEMQTQGYSYLKVTSHTR